MIPSILINKDLAQNQIMTTAQKKAVKLLIVISDLDFSKSFDVVPHDGLLSILKHYGINDIIWLWIYIFNRKQEVFVDGKQSSGFWYITRHLSYVVSSIYYFGSKSKTYLPLLT